MKEYNFIAQPGLNKLRLDLLLSNFSKENKLGISRTLIKEIILKGNVCISGRVVKKPNTKVNEKERVSFFLEEKRPDSIKAEDIKLDIIYEDDSLAVINKPSGMVVHPAPGNYEHTLVNAIKNIFTSLSDINPARPGIVHRLDKETSGLLIIAKDNQSHLELASQFAKHKIEREYIAIVKGRVEFDEGVIEVPIARDEYKRKNMSVNFSVKSKEAKTYYRTLKRFEDFSLLSLKPITGRTHQLRVHLDFIGHPILGDSKYGKNNKFTRLALHAKRLKFIHPKTGKLLEFSISLPEEFQALSTK
jgi:23S rRNA pseudouridine1911/1915/1917 synthase